MVGEHNVGSIRDQKLVRVHGDSSFFEVGDFLAKTDRVHDYTVANDTGLALPENAGRNEVENVFGAVGDDRVAGVIAALTTCNDIDRFCEIIDNFAFAFVAPLESE